MQVNIDPRECEQCGSIFTRANRTNAKTKRFCSKPCATKAVHIRHEKEDRAPRYLGRLNPDLAPTKSPTMPDIYWAAGMYEGEGSCGKSFKAKRRSMASTQVHMCQKDPETLHRLRDLFGGSIAYRPPRKHANEIYDWTLSGPRARGFLMTMYSLMSERRKGQIDNVLGWEAA